MAEKPRHSGVMGWPVNHSLSPKLHGYWLKKYAITGSYVALEVKPEDLAAAVKSLPEKGFVGCNLTVPHKEAVIALLDEVDDTVGSIGAVNTIIVKDGRLLGTNTDAYGFIENIRPALRFKNKAVVLGAGGAARAVVKALADEGFKEIVIINRTQEKANALARQFKTVTVPWSMRTQALEAADLLINTTSLGLKNNPPLEMDLTALPRNAVVTDIVYTPLVTPLLAAARVRGNPIVDGLGMLIHQAVPGFEAWFGKRPEVTDEVRQFLLRAPS